MERHVLRLVRDQSGVVSRRQLLATGAEPHDIARWIRRRELARLLPGVYVDHTGPTTWVQRAWAGVLYAAPAALSHESALRAAEGPGSPRDEQTIHVAIHVSRRVRPQAGLTVHRATALDARVQWHLGPPRVRYEQAVIDVAAGASTELAAIGILAAACQSRRTTARRLLAAVDSRQRLARREWLSGVLDDVAGGTCSALEHAYLTRIERPHGLRVARRQVRTTLGPGVVYRDVEYAGGLVVELDGRLFHNTAEQRDRDFERDLDTAVLGQDTRRISWGQVFDRPCRTAHRIGLLLQKRGWPGEVLRCRECGEFSSPDAPEFPSFPAA
jgi:hypothetical protein